MKGNIKPLTNDELKYLNSRYEFKITSEGVVVITNKRKTLHDSEKGFSLLLPIERRRIKITRKAIDLWSDRYQNSYSLLEVQNAINTLAVTFQSITHENMDDLLKRTRSELDNIYREGM